MSSLSSIAVRDLVRVRRVQIEPVHRREDAFISQGHAPDTEAEVDFGDLCPGWDGDEVSCVRVPALAL